MKRNQHIDRQFDRTVTWGTIFLLVGVVLVGIQVYASFEFEYSNIALFISIVLAMMVARFVKSQIEAILLQRMKASKEFENLVETFEFKETFTDYYEANRNGYFVAMSNHVNTKVKSDARMSYLFLDLFCDCSTLSPEEISEIENKGFIVTHHSIRKFSSNWFVRFNPVKISNLLKSQLALANKYQLNIVSEEEIKSKEYRA